MSEKEQVVIGACRMHACESGLIVKETVPSASSNDTARIEYYCNVCGVLYHGRTIELHFAQRARKRRT